MEPFTPSLEKLLLKNMPHLKHKQMDEYTSISTKRQTVFTHWLFILIPRSLLKPGGTLSPIEINSYRKKLFNELQMLKSSEDKTLFTNAPYEQAKIIEAYNATHEYWAAKRRFALEQGNFVQVPYSRKKLKSYAEAAWNYRRTQFRTLKKRWYLRLLFLYKKNSNGEKEKVDSKKESGSEALPEQEKS